MREILGEKCYTAKEVAEITGMSVFTTRKKLRLGEIRSFRVGWDYYVKENAIREFTDGTHTPYKKLGRPKKESADSQAQTTEGKQ